MKNFIKLGLMLLGLGLPCMATSSTQVIASTAAFFNDFMFAFREFKNLTMEEMLQDPNGTDSKYKQILVLYRPLKTLGMRYECFLNEVKKIYESFSIELKEMFAKKLEEKREELTGRLRRLSLTNSPSSSTNSSTSTSPSTSRRPSILRD